MYCSQCGEPISEGKAFCKNCGASTQTTPTEPAVDAPAEAPGWDRAATVVAPDLAEAATLVRPPDSSEAETAIAGPYEGPRAVLPAVVDVHQIVPPPVAGAAVSGAAAAASQTPPSALDRTAVRPASAQPGASLQAPPPQYPPQYQPESRRGGRGGLIAGIIVAIVILAAAAAAATILLIDDNSGPGTDTTAAQVTTTIASTTTLASTTTSTEAPTSTSASPSTTVDPGQQYLPAMNAVAVLLAEEDVRIPELAKLINAAAPNVPQAIPDELKQMLVDLDAATTELAALPVPSAWGEADAFLRDAVDFMAQRISATIMGVEEMNKTGKVSSATKFFKDGQIARDNFRAAFEQFQATRPAQ